MRFVAIPAALAAVGAAVYLAYVWWTIPTVTVTQVIQGPVVEAFYATGTLLPDREFPIKSHVEGIVTEVKVDKGDVVKAGDTLAFVRVEEYLMRHSQAQADFQLAQRLADEESSPVLREFDVKLQAAMEQLAIAQREADRLTELRRTNDAGQSDLDRALDKLQPIWSLTESIKAQKAARKLELQRDVSVARSAMEIAAWNLQEQTIRSPIDGVVLERPIAVGTRVKGNDTLTSVADVRPERMVMRAQVDEEDKTRLCQDQLVKMTLYAYGTRVFSGRVRRVYPKADASRRTFEVDVAVEPHDPDFAAGMTGELAFIVREKERALVVPTQAVRGTSVWRVEGGRAAEARVQVGLRSVERTEILSGLAVGQTIVISPTESLRDGQAVRTTRLSPDEAAGLNKPADAGTFKGFH